MIKSSARSQARRPPHNVSLSEMFIFAAIIVVSLAVGIALFVQVGLPPWPSLLLSGGTFLTLVLFHGMQRRIRTFGNFDTRIDHLEIRLDDLAPSPQVPSLRIGDAVAPDVPTDIAPKADALVQKDDVLDQKTADREIADRTTQELTSSDARVDTQREKREAVGQDSGFTPQQNTVLDQGTETTTAAKPIEHQVVANRDIEHFQRPDSVQARTELRMDSQARAVQSADVSQDDGRSGAAVTHEVRALETVTPEAADVRTNDPGGLLPPHQDSVQGVSKNGPGDETGPDGIQHDATKNPAHSNPPAWSAITPAMPAFSPQAQQPHEPADSPAIDRASIGSETVEGLVRQLAHNLGGAPDIQQQAAATANQAPLPATPPQTEPVPQPAVSAAAEPRQNNWEQTDINAGRNAQDASLAKIVEHAAKAGQVEIYLQPILSLPDHKVRHFEVLTRLKLSDGAMLMPAQFLNIAAEGGYLPMVDQAMLMRTITLLKKLIARGEQRSLFCNLSGEALTDRKFMRDFIAYLKNFRDVAGHLVLEIGEATLDRCGQEEMEDLSTLRRVGFKLSVDRITRPIDTLKALANSPFEFAKIDANCFATFGGGSNGGAAGQALVALAGQAGVNLIVDKIETDAGLSCALNSGVKLGQGYLFSEPKPLMPSDTEDGGSEVAA